MKVVVNDNCIGCGACTGTAENVFVIGDESVAEVTVEEVTDEKDKEAVKDAATGCPVQAIEITEE